MRDFEYKPTGEEQCYWWPERGKVIRVEKESYNFYIDEKQPEVYTRKVLIEKVPAHWEMPLHMSYVAMSTTESVDLTESGILSCGC